MSIVELSKEKTLVMGILNVTPDSFSDGGKYNAVQSAVNRGFQMQEEGADIIDIGGESSRPGAESITAKEELHRVLPVIDKLVQSLKIPISIDTTKAAVASEALQSGATIINDISALQSDPEMASVASLFGCPVILMHMQGTPKTMQLNPDYKDVVGEIKDYFKEILQKTLTSGIQPNKIILDPGIGFGKKIEHSLSILHRLTEFQNLGYPILVGVSRKSFIGKSLDLPLEERLEGSLAAAALSIWNGANIIRVHDVKESVRVARMVDAIKRNG